MPGLFDYNRAEVALTLSLSRLSSLAEIITKIEIKRVFAFQTTLWNVQVP